MSTDFRSLKCIGINTLVDDQLRALGIQFVPIERQRPETRSLARILSDGTNLLWTFYDQSGYVDIFTAYAFNDPCFILDAIEHDPRYWRFETVEEWEAFQRKCGEEAEHAFYADLLKNLRNEPNNIKPGTIGVMKAEIASGLVADRPELLLNKNRVTLTKAIQTIFNRDHVQASHEGTGETKISCAP
jgi:hypothetical protein